MLNVTLQLLLDMPLAAVVVEHESQQVHSTNSAAATLLELPPTWDIPPAASDVLIWVSPTDRRLVREHLALRSPLRRHPVQIYTRAHRALELLLTLDFLAAGPSQETYDFYFLEDVSRELALRSKIDRMQRQLAQTQRRSNFGYWEYDVGAGELVFYPRAAEILGVLTASVYRIPLHELQLMCLDPDRDTLVNFLHLLANEQSGVLADVRLCFAGAAPRWYRLRTFCQTVDDHSQRFPSGTVEDIHQRKSEQIERERLRERLEMAQLSTGIGSWEIFPDGSAVWDIQTYELFGHAPTCGLPPAEIYRRALSDREYERTRQWIVGHFLHDGIDSVEFQIVLPDGSSRWLLAKGRLLRDADGKAISVLGMNWDVTEEHTLRESLINSKREIISLTRRLMQQEQATARQLASDLHDKLGQSLTTLRFTLDTMRQHSEMPDALALSAQKWQLVNQILEDSFMQLRSTLYNLRPPMLESMGLAQAIQNEVERLNRQTGRSAVRVQADETTLRCRLAADLEYAAFMVFRESVTNALKHSGAQVIEVLNECRAHFLRLSIDDNGIGMTAAQLSGSEAGIQLGIVSMRERAHSVGAKLSINSKPQVGVHIIFHWESDDYQSVQ